MARRTFLILVGVAIARFFAVAIVVYDANRPVPEMLWASWSQQ
jgi:hypothetical protein